MKRSPLPDDLGYAEDGVTTGNGPEDLLTCAPRPCRPGYRASIATTRLCLRSGSREEHPVSSAVFFMAWVSKQALELFVHKGLHFEEQGVAVLRRDEKAPRLRVRAHRVEEGRLLIAHRGDDESVAVQTF